MVNQILIFLDDIKDDGGHFFIEAEATPRTMANFIDSYNTTNTPNIFLNSEGVICLQEDADKWGLELRLYVPIAPPPPIAALFCRNTVYRTEYSHRLNDNNIIRQLFHHGCRIGLN